MADDEKTRSPMGDHVRRAVKRIREAQRLPYTELSERLAALGRPIPVLGLRRIERGERRVDVDDLVALARALSVTPIVLLFSVGSEEAAEILPGEVYTTWDAARWFMGEHSLPPLQSTKDPDVWEWSEQADAIVFYRAHLEMTDQWQVARTNALLASSRADEAPTDDNVERLRQANDKAAEIESAIAMLRRHMRRSGVTPPQLVETLPGLFKRLDQEEERQ